jgi:hypothetical protein
LIQIAVDASIRSDSGRSGAGSAHNSSMTRVNARFRHVNVFCFSDRRPMRTGPLR